jgi:nucleotidyltransferase-like protein
VTVFTPEQREETRERLLELAKADEDVVAAAITGSHAVGKADEWSDIDLAFGIQGDQSAALARWSEILAREFGALHHWDLPWGTSIYRVWLLPGWLEVDIAFTPAAEFGPRARTWRTVFGEAMEVEQNASVPQDDLIGLTWHHLLHARICIARRKPWQAEWLLSGARDHVLELACIRLGYPSRYGKGTDELPHDLTAAVEPALVRSLDAAELERALAATVAAYRAELHASDPRLASRLDPMLDEVVA